MSTTDLKLEECGTLPKPGPIGRLTRLLFGAMCLYYVHDLWSVRGDLMAGEGTIRPLLWKGIVIGLVLISYVINIGFSRSWKKWPAMVSAVILAGLALLGYIQSGQIETPLLAYTVHVWELYIFSHLGLAFVVAALIGTPGCEMRAFHHLFSLVTGTPTKEHCCPIGPLKPIDKWENQQSWMPK
jgi:hypothetical protein